MNDPNFPSNLDIRPLHLTPSDSSDVWKQKDAIRQYGIAGRIWEASSALMDYFTASSTTFNPRCSIFDPTPVLSSSSSSSSSQTQTGTTPSLNQDKVTTVEAESSRRRRRGRGRKRIIELGSGQSVASLHLASQLRKDDLLVLSDLPNVVPLIQQSIDTWASSPSGPSRASICESVRGHGHREVVNVDGENGENGETREGGESYGCEPVAEPMAWGDDISHLAKYGGFTHVVCCDLVYFPNLYPPLLRTLLQLTEPPGLAGNQSQEEDVDQRDETSDDDVSGPEVIIAYKSRTLALEQSFFDSLALYFRLEPVIGGLTDAKIYLCRRWRVTDGWEVPAEKDIMNGSKEVIIGKRGFGLFEEMLGAIEWD